MRAAAIVGILGAVALAGCGGVRSKAEVDKRAKIYPPTDRVCLLAGAPPSDIRYETLGRVVATKRTYGSTDELLPAIAYEARRIGADAVMNLQASQRFKGPLPWRITSPTGVGMAIKITSGQTLDCTQANGRLMP